MGTEMYNPNQMQGMGTPAPVNNADQMQGMDTQMYNPNQMQGMGTPAPVNNADQMQGMGTQMYNADEMEGMGGQTLAMNNTDAMDVTQMNNDYQTQVMDTETPVVNAGPTQEMPNPLNNANNMKDMGGQFDTQCPQGTPKWLCTAYHLTQRFTVEQIEAHARRTRCTMEYFAKEYPNKSFTEAVGMVDQNSVVFTSEDFCNGNPVMENLTKYFDPSSPFVEVQAGFQCIASQVNHMIDSQAVGMMMADDVLAFAHTRMTEMHTVQDMVSPCSEHDNMPAVSQEEADLNLIGWLTGFAEMKHDNYMQSEHANLGQQIQVGNCIFNFIEGHFHGQHPTLREVKQWVEFGGLQKHTCGN